MLGVLGKDAMARWISLPEMRIGKVPFSIRPKGFQMLWMRPPKFRYSKYSFSQKSYPIAQVVLGRFFDCYIQERCLDALPAEAIGDQVLQSSLDDGPQDSSRDDPARRSIPNEGHR